jgi:hypothetical protein
MSEAVDLIAHPAGAGVRSTQATVAIARNRILGISAYYHDSAAALVVDGRIVAAAQEERWSRKKHDARFPRSAVAWCLEEGATRLAQLDAVVFYDKPLVKFERLLETYLNYAPRGLRSFTAAMPVWLKEKLLLKSTLKSELRRVGGCSAAELPKLLFAEHHQSHAASAFFPSPFDRAAVLCLDGVGEWATTSRPLSPPSPSPPLPLPSLLLALRLAKAPAPHHGQKTTTKTKPPTYPGHPTRFVPLGK